MSHVNTQNNISMELTTMDTWASEIADLIKQEKLTEANELWTSISRDLKRWEAYALKDAALKICPWPTTRVKKV